MAQDTFTEFSLSVATCSENHKNTNYPHRKKITNIKNFHKATDFDHTVGRFTDDERSKTNFISADCIFLDVDNDSKLQVEDWNEPKLWMTKAKFKETFSKVEYIITPSKNHRKQKGNRASRERFHVYFPLNHLLTSVEQYEEQIGLLVKLFTRPDGISWFDTNAVDCARLFYGRKKGIQTTPEHNTGTSVLDWMAEHPRKEEIQKQQIVSSPGTKSIANKAGDQSNKHLWMNGWKYKNLVKPFLKTPEIFYGDLDIVSETSTHIKTYCTSGKHEDKNASFSIEKDSMGWICFAGCGKGFSPFAFMALRDNEEEGKITDRFCEELGVENKSRGALYTVGEVLDADELTPEEEAVKKLNQNHALITIGSKVRIMKWSYSKRWLSENNVVEYPEVDFLNAQDFLLYYMNDTIQSGDRRPSVAEVWMKHKDRKYYDGIEFDPNAKAHPKMGDKWNIWYDWETGQSGYGRFIDKKIYDGIKDWQQAHSMCSTYLEHISENICGRFEGKDKVKAVRYVLFWMADALVNPAKKSTVIALQGGQGVGKGQFVDKFAELFGNHYVHYTNSDQMTDTFNWQLKDNLLMFADEAVFAGDRKQANAIKGAITSHTRTLRKLYADGITVPNFTRIIMASNEDWMIPSDIDDRRFFVIHVGGGRQRDRPFFTKMMDEWASGGKEAFCWFLIEYMAKMADFKDYDFEGERIITKMHWVQIFNSNPLVDWYYRILDNGFFQYTDEDGKKAKLWIEEDTTNYFRDTEAIYKDYTDYMVQKGTPGHKLAKNRFSGKLNELQITFSNDSALRKDKEPDEHGRIGKWTVWMFGSLNVLRNEWERKTSIKTWSGQKVIENEHAGVIEQLSIEDMQEDVLGKKKKVVRDFSKIVMDG